MNIFICVLLLSIWKTGCLNRNKNDGSSTTGAKQLESMETKLETLRRHLLIAIIGAMILAFGFGCFCGHHFNFRGDDTGMVRKENIAATSSSSSKISSGISKTASPHDTEEQCMLLNRDKLSGLSSKGNSFIPSSTESLLRSLSSEMSPIRSNTEKFIRPSSQQQLSKPSSSKIVFISLHLEESRRPCSLDKLHELADSHKLLIQGSLSYPNIALRSPWPASLQYPDRSTKSLCRPCPQNQTKSSRHSNVKKPVGKDMANIVSRPQLVKPCQCYQEKSLVSITTPESLANDICQLQKTNAQNLPFPREVTPVSKSFHEVDYKGDALYGNVSDKDKMTNDTDDGSDQEITIICKVNLNDVIPTDAPNKQGIKKNEKHM